MVVLSQTRISPIYWPTNRLTQPDLPLPKCWAKSILPNLMNQMSVLFRHKSQRKLQAAFEWANPLSYHPHPQTFPAEQNMMPVVSLVHLKMIGEKWKNSKNLWQGNVFGRENVENLRPQWSVVKCLCTLADRFRSQSPCSRPGYSYSLALSSSLGSLSALASRSTQL